MTGFLRNLETAANRFAEENPNQVAPPRNVFLSFLIDSASIRF